MVFFRLRLHEGKVIKDRRHHLRTYPNCFVAKELIDWLIEHKEATDRDMAIKIMQKLLEQSIIHHGGFFSSSSKLDWILFPVKKHTHTYSHIHFKKLKVPEMIWSKIIEEPFVFPQRIFIYMSHQPLLLGSAINQTIIFCLKMIFM